MGVHTRWFGMLTAVMMITAVACADGTGPTESVRPGGTVHSTTPPTDDCSVDPNGYGCVKQTVSDMGNCPSGCTTFALGSTYRSLVQNALLNFDQNDPQCVSLGNYATTLLNSGQIRYYNDPTASIYGDWGDLHWSSAGDLNAMMHLSTKAMNGGIELTRTLLHEAGHGYFGSTDENFVESTAQRCTAGR